MSLIPAILLGGWLFIGHIVLMVTVANRYLFRMADHPLKPTVYLLHALFWPGLPVVIVAAIGPRNLGAAFLGQLPGLGGYLWPWLWSVSLAPVCGIVATWLNRESVGALPELVSSAGTILPTDETRLRSPEARAAARWDLARIEITEITLSLPRLPLGLDGLLLAHLTDLHYDGELSEGLLSVVDDHIRSKQPDVILLTGDFVVAARDTAGCAHALGSLIENTPAYGVLGNHDVWADRDGVDRALIEAGVRMLHNQSVRLERNGDAVWVAGVDDLWDTTTDLDAALSSSSADEPAILLSHNPDQVFAAADREVLLQLSGHTHGGHIALPLVGPFVVPSRYGRRFAQGFHKVGNTLLYVNRGLAVRPRIRIGSVPQIAFITLTCGASIAHTVHTQ